LTSHVVRLVPKLHITIQESFLMLSSTSAQIKNGKCLCKCLLHTNFATSHRSDVSFCFRRFSEYESTMRVAYLHSWSHMVKRIVVICQLVFDRLELTNVVEQFVDIGLHRDNVIDQMFVIRFWFDTLIDYHFHSIFQSISNFQSHFHQFVVWFPDNLFLVYQLHYVIYILLHELAVQSDLLQVAATFANCRVRLALWQVSFWH